MSRAKQRSIRWDQSARARKEHAPQMLELLEGGGGELKGGLGRQFCCVSTWARGEGGGAGCN